MRPGTSGLTDRVWVQRSTISLSHIHIHFVFLFFLQITITDHYVVIFVRIDREMFLAWPVNILPLELQELLVALIKEFHLRLLGNRGESVIEPLISGFASICPPRELSRLSLQITGTALATSILHRHARILFTDCEGRIDFAATGIVHGF